MSGFFTKDVVSSYGNKNITGKFKDTGYGDKKVTGEFRVFPGYGNKRVPSNLLRRNTNETKNWESDP